MGVDFIFLSKSDFCSSVLLRESFRLAVILFLVCFCQSDPSPLVRGHLFRVRTL